MSLKSVTTFKNDSFSKKKNNITEKDACAPHFIAAVFTIAREATSSSVSGGMDKQEICTHNGTLLGHERNEIMPFAATRGLKDTKIPLSILVYSDCI